MKHKTKLTLNYIIYMYFKIQIEDMVFILLICFSLLLECVDKVL